MSTVASVLETVRSSGLLEPRMRVLAMLSGGADSVCLVHSLRELLGPGGVTALHVNHGLRPSAGEDERFCVELCERLGVPLRAEQLDLASNGNLEDAARRGRYAAAERVRAAERLDRIAAGHTASDQVETVLYRLATSPGRRALLGMRSRSGVLIRPLLALEGRQTRDYCREAGLDWREDETNSDRAFARNRLRLDVVPALRTIHPAAERNILSTVEQLIEEAALLDSLVEEASERLVAPGSPPALDAAGLAKLAPPLRRLLLRRLAEQAAGEPLALGSERLAEIEALARRGGSGSLDLGAGVQVVSEYGVLRFRRRSDRAMPEPAVLAVPGSCRFGEWELVCRLEDGREEGLGSLDEPLLDAGKLAGRLTVRSWREGDVMRPLGLEGSRKSLQDVFTDRKVPRSLRHRLPVVESDGEIAWVAGVALSERFKITQATASAARLRAGRRQ
jgi:tRNA(Ile)-lysidine synthase